MLFYKPDKCAKKTLNDCKICGKCAWGLSMVGEPKVKSGKPIGDK